MGEDNRLTLSERIEIHAEERFERRKLKEKDYITSLNKPNNRELETK